MTYLKNLSTRQTPQNEPIPLIKTPQVANSAGGFSWQVSDMTRLERFLILGNEGGTCYQGEKELTRENADVVWRLVGPGASKNHALEAVYRIVEVSEQGLAPKNDPALFALAMASSSPNVDVRRLALNALPRVARTGTHLLHFCAYMEQFRGWGKAARHAVARWFGEKELKDLVYQTIKYQSRDDWSMRDLLRLSHPPTSFEQMHRKIIYDWIVRGWPGTGPEMDPSPAWQADLRQIWAFERAKVATTEREIMDLITTHRLPRECVPTKWLTSSNVWSALLADMPMEAMLRNLATMTKVGLIKPMSGASYSIISCLLDQDKVVKARLHPLKILQAMMTYSSGQSTRGDAQWDPNYELVDALDKAFYLAFGAVKPTGKRLGLFVDISGSMADGRVAGMPSITPRQGAAAMLLVTANAEPHCHIGYFSEGPYDSIWRRTHGLGSGLRPLIISRRSRIDAVCHQMAELKMGGTNCAVPMLEAMEHGWELDTFVIYTDSETWFGDIHPSQALRRYREKTGINAKLIVVAMTDNRFTIADPDDAGMLDVVGFSTDTPQVMSWFIDA